MVPDPPGKATRIPLLPAAETIAAFLAGPAAFCKRFQSATKISARLPNLSRINLSKPVGQSPTSIRSLSAMEKTRIHFSKVSQSLYDLPPVNTQIIGIPPLRLVREYSYFFGFYYTRYACAPRPTKLLDYQKIYPGLGIQEESLRMACRRLCINTSRVKNASSNENCLTKKLRQFNFKVRQKQNPL